MTSTRITEPSEHTGVSYIHQPSGATVLVLEGDCTPKKIAFISFNKGAYNIASADRKTFDAEHAILHVDPAATASGFLTLSLTPKGKAKISAAALDQLERILNMDTRGKSKDQIGTEVLRLASQLPAKHPLHTQPKEFADRASAIAALTAVKQAHFLNTPKENTMATTKTAVKTPTPAAKGKAAAPAAAVAATPPETKATTAAKATPPAEKLAKAATEKAKKAKGREVIAGPFILGTAVGKAKSPEELRMHEGSARYQVMGFALSSKKSKFTMEDFEAVAGDQTIQALSVCLKKQYLAVAQ